MQGLSAGSLVCIGLQLSARSHAVLFWASLVGLTVALFLLMRTKWAQSQPISKCIALSVFAHIVFAGFAYGTRIFVAPPALTPEPVIQLALIADERGEENEFPSQTQLQPGDPLVPLEPAPTAAELADLGVTPNPVAAPAPEYLEPRDVNQIAASELLPALPAEAADAEPAELEPAPAAEEPAAEDVAATEPEVTDETEPAEGALAETNPDAPQEIAAEATSEAEEEMLAAADDAEPEPAAELSEMPPAAEETLAGSELSESESLESDPRESPPDESVAPDALVSTVVAADPLGAQPHELLISTPRDPTRRAADGGEMPRPYQSRVAPQRPLLLERYGGNARTEAAVSAALQWLANNQHASGCWRAQDHGAGQERMVLGHNRYGAGRQADTGITGLALLSFLGAGQTHYEGEHRASVQRGLEYLLRTQAADGNLAGQAELFAAMYCHGMAFLALSEAYAMTGDQRLLDGVRRAQQFTLATQIRGDGGWRYQSGDQQGDTSQLGWQLMALRSAEHAGLPIPVSSRDGMMRFLNSVSAGRSGGLASYRAGTRPSPTMTAEAMACWIFLDAPPRAEAMHEAAQYLLRTPPHDRERNFYYWYYGTLAMFHLQDESWQSWNAALQNQLLALQRREGPWAGSWDPETVWGGYGGRVFTTSLGALCLEVYYRYLPLYGSRAIADRHSQPERR